MSIVKMKRLRLFCMAAHREELLRQLQHLGCVQVREPTDCHGGSGLERLHPGG